MPDMPEKNPQEPGFSQPIDINSLPESLRHKLTRENLVAVIFPYLTGSERNHTADVVARAILSNFGLRSENPDKTVDEIRLAREGKYPA